MAKAKIFVFVEESLRNNSWLKESRQNLSDKFEFCEFIDVKLGLEDFKKQSKRVACLMVLFEDRQKIFQIIEEINKTGYMNPIVSNI